MSSLFVKLIMIIVFSEARVKVQGEFAQPESRAIESKSTRAWHVNEESA